MISSKREGDLPFSLFQYLSNQLEDNYCQSHSQWSRFLWSAPRIRDEIVSISASRGNDEEKRLWKFSTVIDEERKHFSSSPRQ